MTKSNPIYSNKTRTNHIHKRIKAEPLNWSEPIWPRADPEDLRNFDPESKVCTMNCGPSSLDPRGPAERKFLCDDCIPSQKETK